MIDFDALDYYSRKMSYIQQCRDTYKAKKTDWGNKEKRRKTFNWYTKIINKQFKNCRDVLRVFGYQNEEAHYTYIKV